MLGTPQDTIENLKNVFKISKKNYTLASALKTDERISTRAMLSS